MKAVRIHTEVSEDRLLSLHLPADVAAGPREVIVLVPEDGDPVAELLSELSALPRRLFSREELAASLSRGDLPQLLVAELQKRLGDHLREVVLFGSRARGDHRPDSDYDCLVLVDSPAKDLEDAIDDLAGELLVENGAVCSLFMAAEEDFRRGTEDPFFSNIHEEGVSLWIRRPSSTG